MHLQNFLSGARDPSSNHDHIPVPVVPTVYQHLGCCQGSCPAMFCMPRQFVYLLAIRKPPGEREQTCLPPERFLNQQKKPHSFSKMDYITELKYSFMTMQRKKETVHILKSQMYHQRFFLKKCILVFYQSIANNDLAQYKLFCLIHYIDFREMVWLKWTMMGLKWMPKTNCIRCHCSRHHTNSNH